MANPNRQIKHFQDLNGMGDGAVKNRLKNWILDASNDLSELQGIKSIDELSLYQNVLTLTFTTFKGVQATKEVSMAAFTADVNVQNAMLENPSQGVFNLIITETDGERHTINLSDLVKVFVNSNASQYVELLGDGTLTNPLRAVLTDAALDSAHHEYTNAIGDKVSVQATLTDLYEKLNGASQMRTTFSVTQVDNGDGVSRGMAEIDLDSLGPACITFRAMYANSASGGGAVEGMAYYNVPNSASNKSLIFSKTVDGVGLSDLDASLDHSAGKLTFRCLTDNSSGTYNTVKGLLMVDYALHC